MARHGNGTVRNGSDPATTTSPATTRTGVGDSDRIRLEKVRRTESKSTTPRFNDNPVYRAKAEFTRRIRGYTSPRGRVSPEADIRFQSIVHRGTHERISAARRRLKHEPINYATEIPRAVSVDFKILDYRTEWYVREKPKEKSV